MNEIIAGISSEPSRFSWDMKMENWIREAEFVAPDAMLYAETKSGEQGPVVNIVDQILTQAVEAGCSDIHFEPNESCLGVRFRLDGELFEALALPLGLKNALVSRLKIMANMDIAEKRLPQDGRFQLLFSGEKVDFRAATLPTISGEKIMLRVLRQDKALQGLAALGFTDADAKQIHALIGHPHGMILVVGPTGSGKTTTLYSILGELNARNRNIVTLEDPVEYVLPGINQVPMNSKIGLTFASALRALLRQDPDVILVGEIRDKETVNLAVQAALTGHLVFSTLHANSGVGTLTRLYDMGLERFLIANSLIGVISQRLVRRLCPHCRESYCISPTAQQELGIEMGDSVFYRSVGCEYCRHLGYAGRIAIYEIFSLEAEIRRAWMDEKNDEKTLQDLMHKLNWKSLWTDGLAKARLGITSLEEVMKVTLMER